MLAAHNKDFNGTAALRAVGEWLTPFYSPTVLALPRLKIGVRCQFFSDFGKESGSMNSGGNSSLLTLRAFFSILVSGSLYISKSTSPIVMPSNIVAHSGTLFFLILRNLTNLAESKLNNIR